MYAMTDGMGEEQQQQQQSYFNLRRLFDAGAYSEAENLLLGMPQDDIKTKHNLAVVRFIQRGLSREAALAALGAEEGVLEEAGDGAHVTMRFEGYETSVYDRAVIYAQCGLVHEALVLLRSLLRMGSEIHMDVLVHSLCLFQILTRPAASLGTPPRTTEDEELVQSVLNSIVSSATPNPTHMHLISAAFADSSNLHEVFSATAESDVVVGITAEEQQALYLNNLGVFSLHDGKAGVAALCFTKARHAAPPPLRQMIDYNSGLCALLRGDYETAIEHLSTLTDMEASPLYWLRLTEALLGLLQRAQARANTAEYEQQQNEFSALLAAGKTFANFEFLLLPGAVSTSLVGPLAPAGNAAAGKDAAARATPATSAAGGETAQLERWATQTLQNALFLLIPGGHSYTSALKAFPHHSRLLQQAMLYWAALELYRKNYLATVHIGRQMLEANEGGAGGNLAAAVYASLLCYLVEALVHLNDPDEAIRTLRTASLAQFAIGALGDPLDSAQRSRVEAVFANLVVAHILTGSWSQAHTVLDGVLMKIQETASNGATEYGPEREVVFTCQLLNIFLELAQGNQERAVEWLNKLTWNV